MKNLNWLLSGLARRGRTLAKRAQLQFLRQVSRKTVWVDYGWMRLPFHGDGDFQEILYHLHGKTWWENERDRLSKFVNSGDVVVDVGANLGFMAGVLSHLVGPKGEVHSFEPAPTTYGKLREVVRENNYANVKPYNYGCGEAEERLQLFCTRSSGHSTLRSSQHIQSEIRSTQEVRIVRLDDFLGPQLRRLDFLKIDTEGFEDAVLAGATGLLRQFKPVVYLELTSEYIEASRRAVKILRENGYAFEHEPILEACHNGENFIALHTGGDLIRNR